MACDARSVVEWLRLGAPGAAQGKDIMLQMCEGLVAGGIPLWRAAVFVRTLHPQITGRRYLWREGGGVEVGNLPFERLDTNEYRGSPVVRVYATKAPLRRRLLQSSNAAEFELLHYHYAEGASDYLASPLPFIDGSIHVATWTTRSPEGFSDDHIAALESVAAPLARVAEIMSLRRIASNLLDTYVGRHAGERILGGGIRRGHTESITAAIWLSDMRGFTMLADRVPPDALISLLNRYFDCQVPAILDHGGEVLKFMGDGLLAIFPTDEGEELAAVCDAALAAAEVARQRVGALGDSNEVEGAAELRFGLALHVGEVLYGNIGGGDRLDFTCIGPAVNLAARLEKLAARLGLTIVASEPFAQRCRARLVRVGEYTLAGFAKQQSVFAASHELPSISLSTSASGSA